MVTTPTAKVAHTASAATIDTNQFPGARNFRVTRSDKQLGTAQRWLWLLERGTQCAYQKCSSVAGVRPIETTTTGITIVTAITIIGIGATGGAAGTTTIGIPGTDRSSKDQWRGRYLYSAPPLAYSDHGATQKWITRQHRQYPPLG